MEDNSTDMFGGHAAMSRLINEQVKIVQINSILPEKMTYPVVLGLGDDNCVYCWNSLDAEWEVYTTEQEPV